METYPGTVEAHPTPQDGAFLEDYPHHHRNCYLQKRFE
jgi:hypothetical protein